MENKSGQISKISLRALQSADLECLHGWLNAPHLKPFYMQEPISKQTIKRKFLPRVGGGDPCRSLIAECDGVMFGYIQWYLNRSFPGYGVATIGKADGVSFDYFVGRAGYLGKGYGSVILERAVAHVCHDVEPKDRVFHVGHEPQNTKAIRCAERAGFVYHEDYFEKGKLYGLYMRDVRPGF